MTLQELLIEKLQHLSPQEQFRVLKFVSGLPAAPAKRKSMIGLFDHLGVRVTEEDIADARLKAWSNFPRKVPFDKTK
jgi:hypothetical protein